MHQTIIKNQAQGTSHLQQWQQANLITKVPAENTADQNKVKAKVKVSHQ